MHRSFLLLVLLQLIFISCSTNKSQILLDDYNLNDSSVTVSILTLELEYLHDQFPDYIFGALRPNEREVFDQQLINFFVQNTQAQVEGELERSILLEIPLEKRTFKLKGGDDLEMIAPKSGTIVKGEDIKSRFVVIFDQFNFTPYSTEVGGGGYAGYENKYESRLTFETKYLIWDNEIKEAIAWGKVSSDDQLNVINSNTLYYKLINNTISKIIRYSPFPASNI